MSIDAITRVLREGLLLILLLSAGPMLASMLVGFIVSVFQATTQIQETDPELRPQAGRGVCDPGNHGAVDSGPDRQIYRRAYSTASPPCAEERSHARHPATDPRKSRYPYRNFDVSGAVRAGLCASCHGYFTLSFSGRTSSYRPHQGRPGHHDQHAASSPASRPRVSAK